MIKYPTRFAIAAIFSLALTGAATAKSVCVGNCELFFDEAYSNADGSVQFVMFVGGVSDDGTSHIKGLTLVARSGSTEHTFVFPSDLPAAGRPILVGTKGFADLQMIKPDFVVPNGFLFVRNGTIDLRPGSFALGAVDYIALPTDGRSAVYQVYDDYLHDVELWTDAASAMNSAGQTYYFSISAIVPTFTGSWFDPAQSGQGLHIEILPDKQFLAAWFTFNPAGTEQSWFVGTGSYSGNTAIIPAVQPTGGRWIPNFNPAQVTNNNWGSLTFTFTDCNHGKVDFVSTLGYGVGSMNLTRLTQPAGLSC